MEYNLKEQLFDKINGLKITDPNLKETWFNWGVKDAYERVEMFFNKELVPEVPQYVADWYEEYKDNLEYSLWEWMRYEPNREKNKKFYLWLNDASNKPVETLVKMKLFGYSVEKEKKYIIKLKNVQKGSESFKFDMIIGKWYFGFNQESRTTRLYHTKKDLVNAGFGWMFSCPGFEIEEVEE